MILWTLRTCFLLPFYMHCVALWFSFHIRTWNFNFFISIFVLEWGEIICTALLSISLFMRGPRIVKPEINIPLSLQIETQIRQEGFLWCQTPTPTVRMTFEGCRVKYGGCRIKNEGKLFPWNQNVHHIYTAFTNNITDFWHEKLYSNVFTNGEKLYLQFSSNYLTV